MRAAVVVTAACVAWLGAGEPAVQVSRAADVDIAAPTPERLGRTPRFGFEQHLGGPTSSTSVIHGPVVPYDPAFVFPFVMSVGSSQVGLSAWTSPSSALGPSGAGLDEINGWVGFGITWTWGGAVPAARR